MSRTMLTSADLAPMSDDDLQALRVTLATLGDVLNVTPTLPRVVGERITGALEIIARQLRPRTVKAPKVKAAATIGDALTALTTEHNPEKAAQILAAFVR